MTFTKNAIDALNASGSAARQLGHDHIGCEHILLTILAIPQCQACQRLVRLGQDLAEMSESMKMMISGEGAPVMMRGPLPLSARTKKVLDIAQLEAGEGKTIGTVDLVLAMMREGENAAAQLLFNAGLTVEKFRAAATQGPAGNAEDPKLEDPDGSEEEDGDDDGQKPEGQKAKDQKTPTLNTYGRDLTALARQGQLDPVVGREKELRRVIQILARRTKNNAVLIGEAGVGKTAVVEGLAQAIHAGAANILKPALARGELQCIGATTLKEYHKSIEKDAALERRFQSVQVDEPTVADAVQILKGLAPRYEEHHSVRFPDATLRAAVELTARYLPSRQLPDKAIDAMDETGARLRMAASVRPRSITKKQEEIDTLRGKKDAAVKAGDFDSAAQYREAIRLKGIELADALKAWKGKSDERIIDVTEEDVAQTVSSMSGVPVEKMNAATAGMLLGMEKELAKVVIGQAPAIGAIARALCRSRALLADPKRPIGSFLFLGPTGVGKTHLAKMLAEKIYGDEKSLIILDMSEYQEKYSSSRLVGAPPGYVGYDEGGQLTEKVRRRPYSVILFDEFEKANADVCNMLLQILDDGRLTDGQGRVIDFRNTIIICTANLGFDFAREGHRIGFSTEDARTSYEILKERLTEEAKRTFRPELLNRFDETVVFRKLEKDDISAILDIELKRLDERLKAAGVSLTFDKKSLAFLAEKGLDPALGARPLRRVVQEHVEDPLADLLLSGKAHGKVRAHLAKDGKIAYVSRNT